MSLCPTIPYFFGNIRQESLSTILKKLNSDFTELKGEKCGECIMNIETFRKKIGVDQQLEIKDR